MTLDEEFVGELRRIGGCGAVAVKEGVVKNPVDAFETWLHAEIGSQALEAFDGERITVGQCSRVAASQLVGDDGRTLDVLIG